MRLNVARFIERTQAEGPGWRAGLWVQGCPILCPGCCNPSFLAFIDKNWIETGNLAKKILEIQGIEGISLLGGEPMTQAEALCDLVRQVRPFGLSVVTYTGYTLEELVHENDKARLDLVNLSDILIAGPFIKDKYTASHPWIGSDNQIIHYLSERYRNLEGKLQGNGTNKLEVRISSDGNLLLNGFAYRGLLERVMSRLEERGLQLRVVKFKADNDNLDLENMDEVR